MRIDASIIEREMMDERNNSEDIVTGMSLRFQVAGEIQQVGGESNSYGFLLVLFFFYFPMKVARGHIHTSWGKSLAPTS